jgi:hypothetical protein
MSYDDFVAQHPRKKLARSESSDTIADLEACHREEMESVATPEKCKTTLADETVHVQITDTDASDGHIEQAHIRADKD